MKLMAANARFFSTLILCSLIAIAAFALILTDTLIISQKKFSCFFKKNILKYCTIMTYILIKVRYCEYSNFVFLIFLTVHTKNVSYLTLFNMK